MKIPFWQVDAFTDRVLRGNPAAVMLLGSWPEDGLLQAISAENNLSETAFLVREETGWHIRWFTPAVEVDLCGHATLASAWVVLEKIDAGGREVTFASRSGPLSVTRDDDRLTMDFPANPPKPGIFPDGLDRMLGVPAREVMVTKDHLVVVLDSADVVRRLNPDIAAVATLSKPMVMITAEGEAGSGNDYVCRCFAPRKGVPEDPVTGSAQCVLAPFWAKRLGRTRMIARQVSSRGGTLFVEDRGARVGIGGHVAPYLEGAVDL